MPADALQRLRQKYPEYSDIPDQELARRIIQKYPNYRDILGDIATGPARPVVAPIVAPAPQQPLGFGGRVRQVAETVLGEGARRRDVLAEALTSRKPLSPDVLTDVLSSAIPVAAGAGLAGRAILRGLRGAGVLSRAAPAVESLASRAAPVAVRAEQTGLGLGAIPRVAAQEAAAVAAPTTGQLLRSPAQLAGVARGTSTAFDLSAPFRQGIFVAPNYPKQFFRAFGPMFRAAFNESTVQEVRQTIMRRPTFAAMQGRVFLPAIQEGLPLAAREEAFAASQLAERIPVLGRVIKASNRAYSTYLTQLRADVFDEMALRTRKAVGVVDDRALDAIGNFVNTATGRGNLGNFERAAGDLATVLFAPRFAKSRWDLIKNAINPWYYAGLPPGVRKEVAKSYVAFAALMGTTLGLAREAGAKVGTDWRSADFLKMKVGNVRYDISAGLGTYMRLIGQLATGQTVSSVTGKAKPIELATALGRFAVGKASPLPSLALTLRRGKDFAGKPLNIPKEVADRFIPMFIQDVREAMEEEGLVGGVKVLPSFFGVGVQTYERRR